MSSASPNGSPRVDFYVLEDADERARLKLVCRLAEKAFYQPLSVCILAGSEDEARDLDMLLWTFRDRSFVPHDIHGPDSDPDIPVVITAKELPEHLAKQPREMLINLAAKVPPGYAGFKRIAELIDGEATRRRQGRERFKFYRDQGISPETHNLTPDHDV